MRRVVVTGMGAVSTFGLGVPSLMKGLVEGRSGVERIPELAGIRGLRSTVAARAKGVDPGQIPRKHRRSMSMMSVFATMASREALEQSGLPPETCAGGRMGVSIGSTVGSTETSHEFFKYFIAENSVEQMRSSLFFKIMNHSCASNVAQALGITGRILAPAAACSTGCQAIGYACEIVAAGKQDFMLSGGADEYHPLMVATFDSVRAASTSYNERPSDTPRPFDRDRDGIVCAEGGGILLLEALDSARRRGAKILAEIAGFATVTDTSSIANPNAASMEECMRTALEGAGMKPGQIDYVNAHATGTVQGDVAEAEAVRRIFGTDVPVSSLKGHLGHTMAASGSVESIATIDMMNKGVLVPTRNLDEPDPACAGIRHVTGLERIRQEGAIKNSFALGGVNSSIVLRRYRDDRQRDN